MSRKIGSILEGLHSVKTVNEIAVNFPTNNTIQSVSPCMSEEESSTPPTIDGIIYQCLMSIPTITSSNGYQLKISGIMKAVNDVILTYGTSNAILQPMREALAGAGVVIADIECIIDCLKSNFGYTESDNLFEGKKVCKKKVIVKERVIRDIMWVCPHCNEEMGESDISAEEETQFHSVCKGAVEIPKIEIPLTDGEWIEKV